MTTSVTTLLLESNGDDLSRQQSSNAPDLYWFPALRTGDRSETELQCTEVIACAVRRFPGFSNCAQQLRHRTMKSLLKPRTCQGRRGDTCFGRERHGLLGDSRSRAEQRALCARHIRAMPGTIGAVSYTHLTLPTKA